MAKRIYEFRCPCCKKRLELDTSTGKVRHPEEVAGGLDGLVSEHKGESERLMDAFDRAIGDQTKQKGRFDNLFKDAKKKVREEDDDSTPPHPFAE